VWVAPERRREGIARELALAAEQATRTRGHDRLRLTVSATNPQARAVWERLGYAPTGDPAERMRQTIVGRGRELEIDATLLALEKLLPPTI